MLLLTLCDPRRSREAKTYADLYPAQTSKSFQLSLFSRLNNLPIPAEYFDGAETGCWQCPPLYELVMHILTVCLITL